MTPAPTSTTWPSSGTHISPSPIASGSFVTTLSAYDAAFLALAEALGVPLITCDGRSAHSSGHRAQIEYFGTT